MLVVSNKLKIPDQELDFTFVRSSGPGGQNVNKVNSKAVLRWAVLRSPSLPDDVRRRFVGKFRRRISGEGDLLLTSQRYRDQGRNVADCLDKLRQMILEVAIAPKARKATRPSRASKRRRMDSKRKNSQKKQGRGRPNLDD